MNKQPKDIYKDIYREPTEDVLKDNSNEGQSISPPPH